MTTIERMRNKLKKDSAYTSPRWSCKVDAMADNQVIAVYRNFEKTGKFNKKRRINKKEPTYVQMTIFDFI